MDEREIIAEEIIDIISKDTKIDSKYIHKHFVKSCQEMKFVSEKIPDLIKKIRQSTIKTYIATDNMDSFDRWTIPAMKLENMFDGIINSFNLKKLKNSINNNGKSAFFDSVLKKEKVDARETILIDDSEDKDNIISSFGINYLKINNQYTLADVLTEIIVDIH